MRKKKKKRNWERKEKEGRNSQKGEKIRNSWDYLCAVSQVQ